MRYLLVGIFLFMFSTVAGALLPVPFSDGALCWAEEEREELGTLKNRTSIRPKPSLDVRKIRKVNKGEEGKVLERKGRWIKLLMTDGTEGWVSARLVTVRKVAKPAAAEVEVVAEPEPEAEAEPTAEPVPAEPAPVVEEKLGRMVVLNIASTELDLSYNIQLTKKMEDFVQNRSRYEAIAQSKLSDSLKLNDPAVLADCAETRNCVKAIADSEYNNFLLAAKAVRLAEGWRLTLSLIESHPIRTVALSVSQSRYREQLPAAVEAGLTRIFTEQKMLYSAPAPEPDGKKMKEDVGKLLSRTDVGIKSLLAHSNTRMMAVVFDMPGCERCREYDQQWETLAQTYRPEGLRFMVIFPPEANGACSPPQWNYDYFVCTSDAPRDFDSFTFDLPIGFLWDWQGKLLGQYMQPAEMEPAIKESLSKKPLLLVDAPVYDNGKAVRGKTGKAMKQQVKTRLTFEEKVGLVPDKLEKKTAKKYRRQLNKLKKFRKGKRVSKAGSCKPGTPMPDEAIVLITMARSKKNRQLSAEIYSPTDDCFLAASTQTFIKGGETAAVGTAAEVLVPAMVGEAEPPTPILRKETHSVEVLFMPIPDDPYLKVEPPPLVAEEAEKKEEIDEAAKPLEVEQAEEWKIAWFTMAAKAGYGYYLKHPSIFGGDIPARQAITAALSFDLGGEGPNFELAPFYTYEMLTGAYSKFHMLGLNIGSTHRWTPTRWAVPSIGGGLRLGYLLGPELQHGFELYARLPVALSVFVHERVALLLEIGLAYGITGLLNKGANEKERLACEELKKADASISCDDPGLLIAHGFKFDVMMGLRFP